MEAVWSVGQGNLVGHSRAEVKMVRGGALGPGPSSLLCRDAVIDFLGAQFQGSSQKGAAASGLCSQVSLVPNQAMVISLYLSLKELLQDPDLHCLTL